MTSRHLKNSLLFLIGLGTCQLIAGFQIYLSNRALVQKALEIEQAGGVHVPGLQALSQALNFNTVFFSALFLTLTLGAGLTFVTLIYVHISQYLTQRPRASTIAFGLFWPALIVRLDTNARSTCRNQRTTIIGRGIAINSNTIKRSFSRSTHPRLQ